MDPLRLRVENTCILGRCLSLTGMSNPCEDTLNSKAKERTGWEPEAGVSEQSHEAAPVDTLITLELEPLDSRVPDTGREQGPRGNMAG